MDKKPNPARQEYMRKWRKAHPEAISRYNRQYWDRRLQREQMQQKEMQDHGNGKEVSDH